MRLLNIKILVLCLTWIGTTAVCQSPHTAVVSEAVLLNKSLSYVCTNQSVEQILKQLSDSFDLKFTYINNEIPVAELRSVICDSCPLQEILDQLFPKGNIVYIPILSQILLKAQKRILLDTLSQVVQPPVVVNEDVALVDSIEVIVIKRGIVTKRRKQAKYVYLKGKLELDHFGSFYDYETVYSFVYDTLAPSSDRLKPQKKNPKIIEVPHSFVAKRDPASIINGNFVSLSFGLGSAYRVLNGTYIDYEDLGDFGGFGGNGGTRYRIVNVKERRDVLESVKINYFMGLAYQHSIGKHFFAKLGVSFVNYGEQGSYSDSLKIVPKPKQMGQPPSSRPPRSVLLHDTTIKYQNEYSYVGVPIGLGFTYGKNVGFTVTPSVVFNMLVMSKISYPDKAYVPLRLHRQLSPDSIYDFSKDKAYYYKAYLDAKEKQYRRLQISLQLDVELFYKFADRYRVFVAPTFSYGLNSIYTSSEPISQRPYYYGVKMGLSYLLNPRKTQKYISLAR